jgi:Zn-dependent M28 family amino/carboxypeptidase
MMKKLLLICLPFVTTLAMAQKTDEAAKYAAIITPQALKEKLTILAGADMEGRETASPGQKKAAAYIEGLFRSYGLKPGNGTSYQQLYPVYQDELTQKKLSVNGRQFAWDQDYSFSLRAFPNGSSTYNNTVFAGYGIVDSVKKINDYAGLDAKGKVVILLDTTSAASGRAGFNALNAKLAAARRNGAIGVLMVSKDFPRRNPTSTKGQMTLQPPAANPAAPQAGAAAPIFTVTISDAVASALLGRTTRVPFEQLKDVNKGNYTAELTIAATKVNQQLESSNVIGVLPGTSKKDEYLFLTGHYDHLGKNGDVIYYGADDDGSGSVGVIQMAEAFAAAAKNGNKPKRTIIFMTVSGEEKGLLGSEYYSEHPTIDLAKATADLNTDMIGRGDSSRKTDTLNYIYVIGHDKLSSDLAVINESVNKQYISNLALDYKFDDPKDPNRIYYRSDHYNFAKKGVPILFFYDGMLGADYHRPSDTVDKIQFDVMARRTQLVFHTAWVIANRDDMLKRDIPLTMPSR